MSEPLRAPLDVLTDLVRLVNSQDQGLWSNESLAVMAEARALLTARAEPAASEGLDAARVTSLLREASTDYSIHAPEGTDRYEYMGAYIADALAVSPSSEGLRGAVERFIDWYDKPDRRGEGALLLAVDALRAALTEGSGS